MDTLTKWFDGFMKRNPGPTVSTFQVYQAGVTTSAISMRARAMQRVDAVVLTNDEMDFEETIRGVLNRLKNTIGQLPDIPDKD